MNVRGARSAVSLLLVVGCLIEPALARASDPPSSPASSPSSSSALAESLANQAVSSYAEKKYEEALRLYTASYAAEPLSSTLLRITITEYQLHRYADALQHARQFLRAPDAAPSDVKRVQNTLLPQCIAQTAHVSLEGSGDTEVAVDGSPSERMLEPVVDLMPGKHVLTFARDGHVVTFRVELKANEERAFSMNTIPEESVFPSPALLTPVRPETTNASSTPSRARWWTVTGLGVASLGSFIAGTVFYVKSENAYARGKDLHASLPSNSACIAPSSSELATTCADLREAYTRDYPHNRDRGLGFVIAGSALAVGALATWFLWPKHRSAPTSVALRWIAPDVQARGASLHLGGTF